MFELLLIRLKLKSGNINTRIEAVERLAALGTAETVPILAQVGVKEEGTSAGVQAFKALESVTDPRAVPLLIRALRHSDEQVGAASAKALGVIADPTSVPALIQVLSDRAGRVRWAAGTAL